MKTVLLAGLTALTATLTAAALLRRRHTATALEVGFQIPANQLPTKIVDRLRHPSAPEYVVTWDRATKASRWSLDPR
ncbi:MULTISPECIES: hypothetical protein [Mycobacterium]|uniref:Secreted protein n=2 Tax=Mycobacterium TaxID=1763 RepID=A0AAW5SBS1_MYCBC|nr:MULTISPECIES: hypothetical protein [Mycobacterium]EUA17316.1 hypothetical protein I552_0517 [Mycobacterium xenopi 3993]EUA65459.1 hypothetical protein I553_10756 [Mycobacterium xenopi 4042]MCV6992978.1 hypothetical protein [Mycobacterium bouchedurhonense]MCV6993187.1 hypothetical protein [Mycobacterium timonense]MDA3642208.1 hypothetical protein [Mycobacterium xenopi]